MGVSPENKVQLFPAFPKRNASIWTGISSCGFSLPSVTLKVLLNNDGGSCCFKSLGFWKLPQNSLDNLLTNFLVFKPSISGRSSWGWAVCTHIQLLIISDSEVNEFIKHVHKRRLPSNLEAETLPSSCEGREQAAEMICYVHFAIGNSNNTHNTEIFKKGIAHW